MNEEIKEEEKKEEEQKPNRGKPPIKHVDWNLIRRYCAMQCTETEICYYLDIDQKTLLARCKEEYDKTFQELRREFSIGGYCSLRKAQWIAAVEERNPTMLIWLGKKYLGQEENNERYTVINLQNMRGLKNDESIVVTSGNSSDGMCTQHEHGE